VRTAIRIQRSGTVITLPSRLFDYFWPARIGKPIFWPNGQKGLNKKILKAQTGPNRPKTGKNVPKTQKKRKSGLKTCVFGRRGFIKKTFWPAGAKAM
jgi:hypothetical protein